MMKKLFLSLAAVVALSATANAQAPTFYPVPAPAPAIMSSGGGSCGAATIPPAGPYAPYGYGGYGGYGMGMGPGGMGPGGMGPGGGEGNNGRPTLLQRLFKKNVPVTYLPTAQGGQLAYPINPYVRSPRDFFMVD